MNNQQPLFERIKQQYGMYPKPMMVNLDVAKTMGKKRQTRRICKLNNDEHINDVGLIVAKKYPYWRDASKWKVGDILWVREPARVIAFSPFGNYGGTVLEDSATIKYLADGHESYWDDFPNTESNWIQKCQGVPNGCLKSMARIFLRVTNVRVERLQEISINDIESEGIDIPPDCFVGECTYKQKIYSRWIKLWNSTAPKGYKWKDNPYVFVYEFEKLEITKKYRI